MIEVFFMIGGDIDIFLYLYLDICLDISNISINIMYVRVWVLMKNHL